MSYDKEEKMTTREDALFGQAEAHIKTIIKKIVKEETDTGFRKLFQITDFIRKDILKLKSCDSGLSARIDNLDSYLCPGETTWIPKAEGSWKPVNKGVGLDEGQCRGDMWNDYEHQSLMNEWHNFVATMAEHHGRSKGAMVARMKQHI